MAFVPVYPEGDDDEIDAEAFWLGEKSAVIGSSKGDQFEVKWMEITIRKHYKFDGTLDVMKP